MVYLQKVCKNRTLLHITEIYLIRTLIFFQIFAISYNPENCLKVVNNKNYEILAKSDLGVPFMSLFTSD